MCVCVSRWKDVFTAKMGLIKKKKKKRIMHTLVHVVPILAAKCFFHSDGPTPLLRCHHDRLVESCSPHTCRCSVSAPCYAEAGAVVSVGLCWYRSEITATV